MRPRLLAITPPQGELDPDRIDAWLAAGAGAIGLAILLREPGLTGAALLASPRLLALRRRAAARAVPTLLSIEPTELEHDPAPAWLTHADPPLAGVQLKGDPSPARLAALRPRLAGVVGRSCHGEPPADAAQADAWVDYVVLAPIFAPKTAQAGLDKRAIGLDALRRWVRPGRHLIALGGIEPAHASELLAAGASGIAGISLFFSGPSDATDNVATLVRAFAVEVDRHVPPPR